MNSPFPPGWYCTPHGEHHYVMTPAEFREAVQQWRDKHALERAQLEVELDRFRRATGDQVLVGPRAVSHRRVQLEIFELQLP